MVINKFKKWLVTFVILALSITAYAIWGNSGFVIALLCGLILETWFWFRITSRKPNKTP